MDNVPALNYLSSEKYFCVAKMSIGSGVMFVSVFHQLLIAVERYLRICRSIQYRTMFSKKRLVIIIIMTWIYSIAMNLPPLLGWNNWSPEIECRTLRVVPHHKQFVIVPHAVICMLAVFGLYVAILCYVVEHRNRMKKYAAKEKKKQDGNIHQQTPASTSSERISENSTTTSSISNLALAISSEECAASVKTTGHSARCREEHHGNKDVLVKPEERVLHSKSTIQSPPSAKLADKSVNEMEIKVAIMTAIVVGTFTLLYIPNVIMVICEKYFNDKVLFGILYNVTVELAFLSSATNPFIYGLLNKEIREAMLNVVKKSKAK
ncbi:tyramine receptor Ser-2-like [Lingula anatina]|uniref:Tyramine receptor Ser-2-like n=1 Tax=Lingula anatina TaxID=7574 RepID=A0A1S3J743_LINAN|nr:tyramine receptor Ser-2-like [Lingula anatina]|eukprot:XP_013405659.1 tyramine receptor Ser-2-like [Lingula anatina]